MACHPVAVVSHDSEIKLKAGGHSFTNLADIY